ncbi:MAG: DNA translocase FtsK 4TM domain-containing protein [Anaerolineae bacterium]
MAKRRGSSRKRKQSRRIAWHWPHLAIPHPSARFWHDLGLAAGFLSAAFILLALLAPTSSPLSQGVAVFLRRLLGWSAYLLPPALATGVYWLGLRQRGLDITRLAGSLLLLLSLLTVTHLASHLPNPFVLAVAGYGGGFLGWAISSLLLGTVGRIGAYLFSLTLFLIAGLLTFDLSPARLWSLMAAAKRQVGDHIGMPLRRAGAVGAGQRVRPGLRSRASRKPVQLPLPKVEPKLGTPPVHSPTVTSAPPPAVTATAPAIRSVLAEVKETPGQPASGWQLPDVSSIFRLVDEEEVEDELVQKRARIIEETLVSLGVPAEVVDAQVGPAVTQFAVKPGVIERRSSDGSIKRLRVRVSKISALADDLALALSASPVRIQAPIPGRSVVGIEVPNPRTQVVSLGSVFFSPEFQRLTSPLALALGRDISGRPVVGDLARMPHLLMAGATGSGKSVCIGAIITCLLARNTPLSLRLVLIDPKRVELATYSGLPHVVGKVFSDAEEAIGALKWATREMDRRYAIFSEAGVRDIKGYNSRMEREQGQPLPRIVIIIDELADLMMRGPDEVERSLCRLAQMARATGIHLVVATQRPSVDVLTGLIKANFPARIAFAVSQMVDSRVVLDTPGAERLLGRGDMLYMSPGGNRLTRAQGCFVSDEETAALVSFWRKAAASAPEEGAFVQAPLWPEAESSNQDINEDPLLAEALAVVRKEGRASTTMLQRHLRIGYTRASRMMDTLMQRGIISPKVDGPFASHSLIAPELQPQSEPAEVQEGASG